MDLLSAGAQPYLVGQKSIGRLRERGQQKGNTAGKLKIKRHQGSKKSDCLAAGETSKSSRTARVGGQKEKETQGRTVGCWLSGTVWDKSLSLVVVCDGHCFSCVVFPDVCPARFLTLSLLLIQLKMPWLHLGGNAKEHVSV